VQQASTSQLIFDFDTLLSHISQYFTLEPGDVLEGFVEDDSVFELPIQ